jgi:prepilin-type N-terminal cleavage/methylation domain-containing protein
MANFNLQFAIFKKKTREISLTTNHYLLTTSRGFTLVELLIYMALVGIFLYSLTNLFVASLDLKLESESRAAVEQDGRFLLGKMRFDITNSQSITTPVAAGDVGDTLVLVRDGVTYSYSLNGENFEVTSAGNTDQLNSTRTRVTNLSFARLGNAGGKNTITMTYTLESVALESGVPELRNYEYTYAIR